MSFGSLFGGAAVIFVAELPDKSLIATLVLGTRYRAWWVWLGVASAFTVHVIIAVLAGGALALLPHRLVESIVAALFFIGAALVLFSREDDDEEEVEYDADSLPVGPTFGRVFVTSFTLIFIGEWGDITQIATANYAAKYDDPLSVGIGATLGLWLVSGLAVTVGARLLNHVPVLLMRRITAAILVVFGIVSAVAALRG